MDKKVIALINLIDEALGDNGLEDEDAINQFSNGLLKIFNNQDALTGDVLKSIALFDNVDVFTSEKYFTTKYKNNWVRKKINRYVKDNCRLLINYQTVKDNIYDNHKLFRYLSDEDKNNMDKINELMTLNPAVILMLDVKYLSEDFVLENMKRSAFVSDVFAGYHGFDNDLYRYSEFYANNNEISNLLFINLKTRLENDVLSYVNYSALARNNVKLADLALLANPALIAYTGKNVRKNKELMLKLIKKDKSYLCFLDNTLKEDKEFMKMIAG